MSNLAIVGRGARFLAVIRRPIVKTAGIAFVLGIGSGALVTSMCSQKPLTSLEQLEMQGIAVSTHLDAFGKNIRFYNPSNFETASDARMHSEGYTRNWFSGVLADNTVMDIDQIRFVFKKETWLGFGGGGFVSYGTPKYDVKSERYGLIREGYTVHFNSENGTFDGQSMGPTLGPAK